MGQEFEFMPPLVQNGETIPRAPGNGTEEPPPGNNEVPPGGELPPSQAPATENGGILELAKKNPMLTIAAIFLLARMARII